jgi:N-acetyl-anhydromuramyl-L-alanine amidase AmpD
LHGTAGGGTIEWFKKAESKASAHYVVEQDGSIVQMVNEADSAWHNGERVNVDGFFPAIHQM